MTRSYHRLRLADSPEVQSALQDEGCLGCEISPSGELIAWFDRIPPESILRLSENAPETIPDEDWSTTWREGLGPVRVGPFFVRAGWMPPAPPECLEILLEPGCAFGTGHHETTRLTLSLLARALRPGDAVLDFGSGSGILSIAAARLGAGEILAVEIDDAARAEGERNAHANGILIPAMKRLPEDRAAGFDIIVANIEAAVLEPNLARLRNLLRPGGRLILSGLLVEDPVFFGEPERRLRENAWLAVELP